MTMLEKCSHETAVTHPIIPALEKEMEAGQKFEVM